MGDGIKSLSKVGKNKFCSPVAFQASNLTVEDCQSGWAWFPHYKSMFAIPSHLLVLLPGNYFQDYLLHYITRDWIEADQSISRQKGIGVTVALFQFSRRCPSCHFKVPVCLSKMTKSNLVQKSGSSHSAHGYNLLGHIDLSMSTSSRRLTLAPHIPCF